ncbi:MAG: COX15/CtaA family protein [Pseudomonadota bacterium]
MAKGAVFEEVGAAGRREAEAAAPTRPVRGPAGDAGGGARMAIALWLWALAALVAVMVLVGGLTRLTDSGLSITVWAPVMGAIPPLSDADWQAAFDAYKTTTEYQEQNAWMTLDDFKPIYWWEWGHRQLGRFIGLVWAVGLGAFLLARAVPRGWTWRLVLPGVLGGVQGAIGWWMVASGLTDRLDVASYRLAVHLGLAFVIFGLLVWAALRIRLPEAEVMQARRRRAGGRGMVAGFGVLLFAQILVGALVAGIDAGRSFTDWPLMSGQFFPETALDLEPVWVNFFENAGLVQFVHRMLGYVVLVVGLLVAWRLMRRAERSVRWHGIALGVLVLAQTVLGIVTVLYAAPLEIAIWHQAGGLALMGVLVSTAFVLAYPPQTRIRG